MPDVVVQLLVLFLFLDSCCAGSRFPSARVLPFSGNRLLNPRRIIGESDFCPRLARVPLDLDLVIRAFADLNTVFVQFGGHLFACSRLADRPAEQRQVTLRRRTIADVVVGQLVYGKITSSFSAATAAANKSENKPQTLEYYCLRRHAK